MIVIGLTGGIASGKSTVSKILMELGAKIIDADLIAREIVEPKKVAWQEIVAVFGEEVLQEDLTLNRKRLGEIVFSNKEALDKLNQITHPRIIAEAKGLLKLYKEEGIRVSVIDAALLLETGMDKMVDEIWVVQVEPKVQVERLIKREGITREEALKRINSQSTLKEKLKVANRVVDNSGTEEELRQNVTNLWEELLNGKTHSTNCP